MSVPKFTYLSTTRLGLTAATARAHNMRRAYELALAADAHPFESLRHALPTAVEITHPASKHNVSRAEAEEDGAEGVDGPAGIQQGAACTRVKEGTCS